ncbi:MAG: hypothetical protein ACI8P9_004429 [Parasphingorhabdus sp.]|jgi:hypothetical protein
MKFMISLVALLVNPISFAQEYDSNRTVNYPNFTIDYLETVAGATTATTTVIAKYREKNLRQVIELSPEANERV